MRTHHDTLILGGTGHLGRDLTRALLHAGVSARIASRRSRPGGLHPRVGWAQADLVTGQGVRESVEGVHTLYFCAGAPRQHAALEVEGLKRLLVHAREAGVAHLVFVSIVGIEHLPVPYYRTKLAAEAALHQGGVPFTILRATQFHYFIDLLLSTLAGIPFLLLLPKDFQVQPVATQDVADRLVRCLHAGPQRRLPDFCGPEILSLHDAAKIWKQARGIRRPTLPLPIPGRLGAAFRRAHNTNPRGERGTITWSQWLASGTRSPDAAAARLSRPEGATVPLVS